MLDLFDVPWSQLDLDAVRRFLDDAGEEGVTWEAKADDDEERHRPAGEEPGRLRPQTIRKAVSGLANQIGGYLIIGARWDKEERSWRLPGIVAPDPEPKLWLGKVLRSLNPVPRFDPKAWALDDDRTVAVVQVEPVAEPPCMTPQGHVYERVSGETLRVTDPALLDSLFRRGREARDRAEQFARRAAVRALEPPGWSAMCIVAALAPTGRETTDITSRLFIRPTREAIIGAVGQFATPPPPERVEIRQQQDAFAAFSEYEESYRLLANNVALPQHQTLWRVQATWDGTVAACAAFSPESVLDLSPFDQIVGRGWREIAALVARLGGYGPAHLTIGIDVPTRPASSRPDPPRGTFYARLPQGTTWIERAVSVDAPSDDVLASIERELRRAGGEVSDEPVPESPGS